MDKRQRTGAVTADVAEPVEAAVDAAPSPASSTRLTLPIRGMSCAACAARIEKVLSRQEGVRSASVNFATREATVEYDPARVGPEALSERVRDAGYQVAASPVPGESTSQAAPAAAAWGVFE